MLGFYNYTVIATYLSAASASVGIMLTLAGKPTPAVFCLFFCGILDMFDGKIARTCPSRSIDEEHFGIQIDSLADLVAFGILPAAIGFSLWGLTPIYVILAALYFLAALIRLAYFNVTELTRHSSGGGARQFYTGLPVTSASFTFPALWCISAAAGEHFKYIYAALMLAECVLFVSKIKIKKPHGRMFLAVTFSGALLLSLLIFATARGLTI